MSATPTLPPPQRHGGCAQARLDAAWPPRFLTPLDVAAAREAHEARVGAEVAAHLRRRERGERHPVADFLFSYYSLRPAKLLRWRPPAQSVLLGSDDAALLEPTATMPGPDGRGSRLDVPAYWRRREDTVRFVHRLLTATRGRAPHLRCFGLHEWAMVYRAPADEVRHQDWPLRLGREGTDAVVDAGRLACTHHDALRFFTAPARERNAWQVPREAQVAREQPGCVHATMDLYKWAYKVLPLAGSDLLAECFELARSSRSLDMAASPYDLRGLGVQPVRIETAQGRAEYVRRQRELAEAAGPVRDRLITICSQVIASCEAR